MAKAMVFTKTALRNLFSKPATTAYPAVPKEYPERTRGHVSNRIEDCIFCGMCMRSCPPGAIKVVRGQEEGTWTINRFDCIQCANCVEKCPKKCLSITPGYQTPGPEKFTETLTGKVILPKPPVKPAAPATTAKPAAPVEGKAETPAQEAPAAKTEE